MAFDGMSITAEAHEGPTIHKVTVENLKQSIKSQGIRGRMEKGRNNACVSTNDAPFTIRCSRVRCLWSGIVYHMI